LVTVVVVLVPPHAMDSSVLSDPRLRAPARSQGSRRLVNGEDPFVAERADRYVHVVQAQRRTAAGRRAERPEDCREVVPNLWAVTPAGDATAYLISGLSATAPAKIKALAPQHLS
jgi:hypothetical protein